MGVLFSTLVCVKPFIVEMWPAIVGFALMLWAVGPSVRGWIQYYGWSGVSGG